MMTDTVLKQDTTPASDAPSVHAESDADNTPPAWPMLYRNPVVLSSQAHAHWRLRAGDAAFAADSHSVPLMIGEFAAASRAYPMVFAGADHLPVAVLSCLERRSIGRRIADGDPFVATA